MTGKLRLLDREGGGRKARVGGGGKEAERENGASVTNNFTDRR